MTEAEFLQDRIKTHREALAEIPLKYQRIKKEADKRIDALLESAGILPEVQRVRDSVEASQKALQSQADKLQGALQVMELLMDKWHQAPPLPEGVTHMYGIDLRPLDAQTRLKVMGGQGDPSWAETIEALGGTVPPTEGQEAPLPPSSNAPVSGRRTKAKAAPAPS